MRKTDLVRRLARRRRISRAQAADQIDGVVHDILRSLRRGRSAALPGLGTFQPGSKLRFQLDPTRGSSRKKEP